MGKLATSKSHGPPPLKRRKSLPQEQQKKEKGRSRNACDRCKQKKVKCDGEGLRTCTICLEGDFHCHYAQKAHSEKNQYRKGYVEMVEEANEYYKNGIHRLYELFKDKPVFKELKEKYGDNGRPTAQEIARSSGVPSTNKPHERGLEKINQYLVEQSKPMLVRKGEWDRVQSSHSESSSPNPSIVSSPASSPRPEQQVADSPADYPHSSSFAASTPSSPTILQAFSRKGSGDSLADSPRHSTAGSIFHAQQNGHKPKRQLKIPSSKTSLATPETNDSSTEPSSTSFTSEIPGRSATSPLQPQSQFQLLQRSSQAAYATTQYNPPIRNHSLQAPATSPVDSNSGTVCLADLDLNQHPMASISNNVMPVTSSIVTESQLFGTDPFPSLTMGDTDLESIWIDPFRGNQPIYGAQEAGI